MLAVNSICLTGGVLAATAPNGAVATETVNDIRQDKEVQKGQAAQDTAGAAKNEKQDEQVVKNSEDIEDLTRLTGNQTFILQLIGIFMPLLSLVATGYIAVQQSKAKNERHVMAEETRSNLGHMGRSINGMKSELVAAVKAAAFAEGATHAIDANMNPDTVEQLRLRAQQLAKEAEEASRKAAALADEAVRKIEEKPANSP